ncbi:MAG: cohesin domain-containing protein [Bacillota bacterium]
MHRTAPRWFFPAAVMLLCVISFAFGPAVPFARAAAGTAVIVDGAAGEAGQTVVVTVRLRGLDRLTGVSGISGGQFELVYDPAAAVVDTIRQGSAIGDGFLFLANRAFSENSVKVVWAAESALITGDGDLCNVTFSLRAGGAVQPVIENLSLFDQDLRPLAVAAQVDGSAFHVQSPPGATKPSTGEPGTGEEGVSGDDAGDADESPGNRTTGDDETEGDLPAPDEESEGSAGTPLLIRQIYFAIPAVLFLACLLGLVLFRRRPARRRKR